MRVLVFSCALILIQACGASPETQSELRWLTGAGPTRGHEDITRIGVDRANDALEGLLGYRPYPSIAKGVAGIDTGNSMVKGNYETDFPGNKMRAFHGVSSEADWHNDGRLQHAHSLRDYPNGSVLGLRDACGAIRKNILEASARARDAFHRGEVEEGRYWLGHATHVVQDSFSPAHTQRGGHNRRDISNICVYGTDAAGACKHAAVDLHDQVWRSKFDCQFNPNNRGFSCMKDEAQHAVVATASFLRNAGVAIFGGQDLDQHLQKFFNDPSLEDEGYFICENLPL